MFASRVKQPAGPRRTVDAPIIHTRALPDKPGKRPVSSPRNGFRPRHGNGLAGSPRELYPYRAGDANRPNLPAWQDFLAIVLSSLALRASVGP
jgi:hypothetical protein